MLETMVPIKRTLDLNTRLFVNALEGISDEEALRRPNDVTNHIAFLAAHVVDARYFMAREVGLGIECPFKDSIENAKRLEDVSTFPALDALRAAWSDISGRLSAHLESSTAEVLGQKASYNFPIEGGETASGSLTFLLQHESYHLGQIALVRRFLGHEAMSYG
jgi:uncharacterized damage-inducible protein DinB